MHVLKSGDAKRAEVFSVGELAARKNVEIFMDSENPEDRSYLEIIHGFYKKAPLREVEYYPVGERWGFDAPLMARISARLERDKGKKKRTKKRNF